MKGNVFYMPEKILLQGIFLTQGSNPGLLHCRKTPYCLSHPGKSYILEKMQNIDIKRIQKRETFFSEMTRGDCLEEASFKMRLEEWELRRNGAEGGTCPVMVTLHSWEERKGSLEGMVL